MNEYLPLLLGTLLLSTTACDRSNEFYVQHYAVERVEAVVEAAAQDSEADDAEVAEDLLLEEIRAEIMAAAPVEAGGGYTLRFTEYNGGPLELVPTAGAAALTGSFRKAPGSTTLEFLYDGMRRVYTLGSYRTDERETKVLLQLDLTDYCRERYPDAGIERALRREYTSTPY